MSISVRIVIISAFLFVNCFTGSGQILSFTRLNSEDGLSNNLVQSIIQDHQGFMWFGTREGLNRYDGSKFKIYRADKSDTTAILDDRILSIFQDSYGELWIATNNGLSKYNRPTDNFSQFPVSFADAESFRKEPVGAITEDLDGNLWFGNQVGGIYKFNRSTKKYTYFDHPAKSISELYVDRNNRIYAGTKDCELYFFDPATNGFLQLELPDIQINSIPDNYIWNIFQNSEGEIVLNTSHCIYKIDVSKGKSKELPLLSLKSSTFRNNEIRDVYEVNSGCYWVGTWGKGLYYCDLETGEVTNYQVEPGNESSLGNNDVNTIFEDRGGVLWIGTQEGLTIIDPVKDVFRKYQNDPKDSESLHFNFITSFCEDQDRNIWIGTYGGGVSRFNHENHKFETIVAKEGASGGLINNAVRAICEDKSGNIWVGTMKGIDCYNPATGKHIHYTHDVQSTNSLPGDDVLCIINGSNNDLWVGMYGGGLCHIQLKDGVSPVFTSYRSIFGDRNTICSDYIRSLSLDKSGNLWIGSLGAGVDKLNQRTGKIIHYPLDRLTINGKEHRLVNCIHHSNDSLVWMGTDSGLLKLNLTTDKITSYSVKDGLPDNSISEIQEDQFGNLWISTFKGIVKLDHHNGNELAFVYYTSDNGLQGNKFNVNASLRDENGLLYFGGTTGFNIIDPSKIRSNNYIPPVVLTDLLIFNEPVRVNQKVNGRIILDNTISFIDELVLSHKDRIITIEFAALSYSESDKNTYMYYLEGVDKQWVTVDSKRKFVSYSNLPPGNHLFRVIASNSDGLWNEQGASLSIKVLPPPWKTWYAFLMYTAIIVLGLIVIRRYTLRQSMLQHKLEIEGIERQKTEELNQLKFQFFTNISHEVRTPLTLILGPLEKLLNTSNLPGVVLDQLYMINRNSKRLLSLINQLMDFRKIEMGKLVLNFNETDIIDFISEIKGAFDDLAKDQNIDYMVNSSVKHCRVWIDRGKFETAVYNILSNAFKYTNRGGEIKISVHTSQNFKGKSIVKQLKGSDGYFTSRINETLDYVIIKISDSGIGIPPEKFPRIFERFYQAGSSTKVHHNLNQTGTGIGLSITKEIIQMHQGSVAIDSRVGRGTSFYVFVPLGESHIPEEQKNSEGAGDLYPAIGSETILVDETPEQQYFKIEERLENEFSSEELKILVIEDNPDIRKFIVGAIQDSFTVLQAENGVDGFEVAIKHLPDLVISDIMMPVMNGHELCIKLKSDLRTSHIPIILLTAYDTLQNHIKGYQEGADDYLAKPFNARLLNVRIFNLIENRRKLRENFNTQLSVNPSNITVTPVDSKFLEKAIKIVEERMDDPEFNVVTFGRELCMSRTNLFRKLKSLTGLSASEFIRNIRVKRAAGLLLEGYNVSQVMDLVGISSRSYFNKCFYEQFSKTPSEYIKEYIYSN